MLGLIAVLTAVLLALVLDQGIRWIRDSRLPEQEANPAETESEFSIPGVEW